MCNQVDAIFRGIQFLEANLKSDITVSRTAEEVGYSLFHFMRTFNHLVHHTPFDYLTRRRLSEAAKMILSTDRRLMDVAMDYGFSSQESFSRAFKRMFNIQPSQWRENGVEFSHLLMPPRSKEDLRFINQRGFSSPTIEKREKIILYGLMSSLRGSEEISSCQLPLHEDLLSLLVSGRQPILFEVSTSITKHNKRVYVFLGIEDKNLFRPPTPVVQFTVPAGSYASIRVRNEDRQAARTYLSHTWLAGKGYLPKGLLEICTYDLTIKQSKTIILFVPIDPVFVSGR